MSHDVFGIGNALVDLQVRVTDEDLDELTLPKGGMELTTPEEQSRILDALSGRVDNICSGGSAANTMHGIGALGGDAYYLGRVANDEYGKLYTRDMEECGVGFPGPDSVDTGTGTSIVLITPDAQRTLATHLGISVELHPDNVDPTIVRDSGMVYIEGYLWDAEDPRAAAIRVAEIANKANVPVAFTVSDSFLIHRYRDELLEFINKHVDVLFCNETEGCALADQSQASLAFREVSGMVAKLFFTLSDKGAWVAHEGDEPTAIRPFAVDCIDTTGAGDLFAAGAIYGLTHDHSLEDCGILGGYLASRVISKLGARLDSRYENRAAAILEEYHSALRTG